MDNNHIRKFREMAGLSQAELGKKAGGIAQQTIDLLEKGERLLKVGQLEDIADVLGVMPYQLINSEKWNPHNNFTIKGLSHIYNSTIKQQGDINPAQDELNDYEAELLRLFRKLSLNERMKLVLNLQETEIKE